MSEIEVNSVHWYYSGDNRNSDADMAEQARAALAFKKPVYFTETGMIWHNWDPDSHNLMRIRSWTAFFEAANLMWWNTAGTQSYHGESGNMYLGPTERGYQRILREFVNSMTDPGVQAMNVSATEGVRAYGLMGVGKSGAGQVYMVYAHHFANHIDQIKTVLAFASGAPISSCTSTWVSPADGSVTLAAPGADGASFQSPPFAIDVALLVHCSASLPKAQEVMFFA